PSFDGLFFIATDYPYWNEWATFRWNEWQVWTGIGDGFDWNTQVPA
ncbi:hypothetical protein ICN30_11550, partial [Polynucleobacter sp. 31A-FELB]|nr:hypothetical protein [Polynucleobacter sp. 31A-FELB]